MLASPPARETDVNEEIEAAQRPPADPAEVVASAPDVRVEFGQNLVEAQPRMSCPSPEFISDAPQRRRTDVEVQPSRLPAMRVPEKYKGLTPRVDHPRLLRMQGQAEPREQVVHPRPFSVRPSRRQQYEIIRIPDEPSLEVASLNALTETPVEQVEVHVREERRNHSPNAKGNFQFEHVIVGWRSRAVLDLRRR